jgi:hypothetical protein
MNALHLRATIGQDRRIVIDLPVDFDPGSEIDVIVVLHAEPKSLPVRPEPEHENREREEFTAEEARAMFLQYGWIKPDKSEVEGSSS